MIRTMVYFIITLIFMITQSEAHALYGVCTKAEEHQSPCNALCTTPKANHDSSDHFEKQREQLQQSLWGIPFR